MLWRPSADITALKARAAFLKKARAFFDDRGVYEVDPPLLSAAVATDLHLSHFDVMCEPKQPRRFLQTSPEFAMKRLLAAGSGPIYCLNKAFRKGESGQRHNPEFTMLEWYRPHWDHHQLMDEVDAFVSEMVGTKPAEKTTYAELFLKHCDFNPHTVSLEDLKQFVLSHALASQEIIAELDKDNCLDLIMSLMIEPTLGHVQPIIVTDYPASQASLSRVQERHDGNQSYQIAERFEYYLAGMELANGYHELTCVKEQESRFLADIANRHEKQLPQVPVDKLLLLALENGMPSCAGVALGVDRLLMFHLSAKHITEVLPFDWERA